MKKRVFSLVLCFAILLAVVPVFSTQAYAADDTQPVTYDVNIIDNNSKSTTDAIIYEPDCDIPSVLFFIPAEMWITATTRPC